MRRHLGWITIWAFTVPVMLAGCAGSGNETNAGGKASPTAGAQKSGPDETPKGKPQPEGVTPIPGIEVSSLIRDVKEEVKGGEAQAGPSPSDHLWQFANESLIKDEPLTVKVPDGLPPLTPKAVVPLSNPLTKGKVELGKQLYFDPRISLDGTVSCATCHNPLKGWADGMSVAIGIRGQAGGRSAPTVLNTAYGQTMFWDGRAPSLEAQSQGPPQNPIEMGNQTYKQIVDRLRAISGYREQFQKVFGTDVTLDGIAKAIASFERATALSGNSKYDKYRNDVKALSDSEKRGMVLFGLSLDTEDEFKTDVVQKKAKCTSCHVGFNFTDDQFHNLGVGWDAKKREFKDKGRWAISPIGSKHNAELGAFKTPTVRDITRTAPYMHDGSLRTLEEVVEHYDKGGEPNPFLDVEMTKLKLTAQEKADVVAFMKALTGDEVKVELPKLPVGPDGKSPDPKSALSPPAMNTAANGHELLSR